MLIDSLLSVDQYRGADKAASSDSDGKPCKDIAEVAAATELILPKGSFRTTSSVRHIQILTFTHLNKRTCLFWFVVFSNKFFYSLFFFFTRPAAQLLFYCMGFCVSISRLVWTGLSAFTRSTSMAS